MKEKLRVTPEELRGIINWQYALIEHVDACLKLKKSTTATDMAKVIATFNHEELVAIANGANKILDCLLFEQNCYNGYDTLGEKKVVKLKNNKMKEYRTFAGKGHPEFAEWRRKYLTRDVTVD